ncbi:unnamed protein product [Rotaria magnacalcarata]|uniref:CBS domain-containing protein n=1 Tax=Rotaria magnacalcarata TaxID=392030 RepID=A0A816FI83_9BILA|nr:unnamed protein product [Rotaria magnacalcarata]CAF3788707.1 unnamed protein product [Rotaria magnacalcarata]
MKSKNKNATLKLLEDKNSIVATALLGSNLANIFASSLVTVISIQSLDHSDHIMGAEIAIATFATTAIIFLFAEVLPKTIALNSPEKIAIMITPIFKIFMLLFSPIIKCTDVFNKIFFRIIGIQISNEIHIPPHEEIKNVVQMRHEQGKMIKDEKDMLHAVLELSETDVECIMCHRNEVFAIDINEQSEDIFNKISTSKFSRIPFYDSKPDNIIGFLHIRDFFFTLNKVNGDINKVNISLLLNKPVFVPHKTNLKSQLSEFRRLKTHMMFVVDEYGGIMGLITFEDLLEEIVGDIADEHDTETYDIVECSDGSILVVGDYPVRDFNKRFDADFNESVATTIAGLVINNFARIPKENEDFNLAGYNINIYQTESSKILKLKLIKI